MAGPTRSPSWCVGHQGCRHPAVGCWPRRSGPFELGLAQPRVEDSSLRDGVELVWSHPQVLAELAETLGVLEPG